MLFMSFVYLKTLHNNLIVKAGACHLKYGETRKHEMMQRGVIYESIRNESFNS